MIFSPFTDAGWGTIETNGWEPQTETPPRPGVEILFYGTLFYSKKRQYLAIFATRSDSDAARFTSGHPCVLVHVDALLAQITSSSSSASPPWTLIRDVVFHECPIRSFIARLTKIGRRCP